ncbi:MAG: magnesium/cobalt transporter CorA [Planctomycetes bacterium]|nr:magnesium/cobalt transporter CorA [Planctomycetota bacterium]
MQEKSLPPPGSRPGTLAPPPDSPPTRIRVVSYDAETLEERTIDNVESLAAYTATTRATWVDVQGFGDEHVLRRIADLFDVHPLALEDAVNVPHRASTEVRGRHHVIIARAMQRDDRGRLTSPQVCLVLGPRVLITFQDHYLGLFEPVRERIREGIGPMRRLGPDYLAYALLDAIVDRWFPVLDAVAQGLEQAEDQVIEDSGPQTLGRLHRLRRDVTVLRRVGWPQREALQSILRDPSAMVSEEVRSYLRDTSDHMTQIMEGVDACREMVTGLMDLHLSTLGHRTNEVMKVLTLMASIFIPLTFLAGLYGMNFHDMPELDNPYAYPILLAIMVAIAVAMLVWFRRRGWIGPLRRGARIDSDDDAGD